MVSAREGKRHQRLWMPGLHPRSGTRAHHALPVGDVSPLSWSLPGRRSG